MSGFVEQAVIDYEYLLRTLKRMIQIRSISPNEQALAEFIAIELHELGLEPELHEVATGRPNVYAILDFKSSGRFLTFAGHLDTVDVAQGWMSDPFEPIERNGRLFGLGSCDMKGGLACVLAALHALLHSSTRQQLHGRVGFAATVDEEGFGTGARALLATPYARSDGILLAEPHYADSIDNAVPIGMTGKVLYRITVHGQAAHGFHSEKGINAIEDAARIIAALDRLQLGTHPILGQGNICTLKIEGGYKEYAVVVPEECQVIINRLTVPGENRMSIVRGMVNLIDSLNLASRVSVEILLPTYEPYILPDDSPLILALESAYQDVIGKRPCLAAQHSVMDSNIYVAEGDIPTVACGPRGAGIHEANEYVELATLVPITEVYVSAVCRFLSSSQPG